MRSIVIFLAVLFISMSGCSHLILSDSDSTPERTGKVAARVLLFPVTLGLSEVRIMQIKEEIQCDAEGGWWFMGACRENSEANRNRAMMLMPGLMQSNSQYFNRPIQTPVMPVPSQPLYQPQPSRQPLNCTSFTQGGQTHTTCY